MREAGVSVFSAHSCHLGEGPTYDPQRETLFWFDILERKLLEKKYPKGETTIHDLPEMASALAVVDAERQLLVTETGLHLRDVRTGALRLHMPIEADNPATRSNDARVHPCGAFWIGTMGKTHEAGAGSIYWFLKGELRRLYSGISIPNSICFSEDGRLGFYTDAGLLMRVECDPATGLPTGDPKIFVDHRGEEGHLDGSVMDRDGLLWNACWGAGRVNAYDPDGRLVRSIRVPVKQPSCPAFIGPKADRLTVTSAREGLAAGTDPEAGKTFLLDIAVNGRFEPRVLI